MPRYEITGTANDVYNVCCIRNAMEKAGAIRINMRRAFGMRNQPKVVTFFAESEKDARLVCDKARAYLDDKTLPALLPFEYTPNR